MNPFDLPGPRFLELYALVLGVAVVLACMVRWLMRLPADDPGAEATDLEPYEAAYLAGGARRAIETAIVRLVRRKALVFEGTGGRLKNGDGQLKDAHPLEGWICAVAGGAPGKTAGDLQHSAVREAEKLSDGLLARGLLVRRPQAARLRLVSSLMVIAVGVFGLIKLVVGLERHRPVGFLAALLVGTAVVAVIFFFKMPFRSRRGDKALAHLQHENAALAFAAGRRAGELGDTDLLLAMGLFGSAVLVGGPLAHLQSALLAPRIQATKSSGSSCGSSCSSAATCGGGGGGCGGGGGGGCGGCGSG